jgi:signal transduction histidine kinase
MTLTLTLIELSLVMSALLVALIHFRLGIMSASMRVLPEHAENYFTLGLLSLSWVIFWTVLSGTEKASLSFLGWIPLLFCGFLAPAIYLFVQSYFYSPAAHPIKLLSLGGSGTGLSIFGLISGNTFVLLQPNQTSMETNSLLIFKVLSVIYLGQLGVFLCLTVVSLLRVLKEKHPHRSTALWFLGGLSLVIIFLYLSHGGIQTTPFIIILSAVSTLVFGQVGYGAILSLYQSQEQLCQIGQKSQLNHLQLKSEEIRILNHKFNNYLATIMGNIELLKIKIDPSDPNIKYIDRIIGITALSNKENKVRGGALNTNKWETIDVIEHIQGILTSFNCSSSIRSEYNSLPLKCIPTLFEEGMVAVIQNAIDTETSVSIEIKAELLNNAIHVDNGSLQLGQNYIQILISDSGPRIPMKVRHLIWEPYFSTKPDHNGMGLTKLSNLLINLEGACQTHIDSKGRNTFVIWLPKLTPESPE